MALRPYPGFVGPSYTSESRIAAYDRTVNWYPERVESGTGPARYVLYPTPGYEPLAGMTGLSSPGRGLYFAEEGGVWFVSGTTFYQATSTFRGSVSNTNDTPVFIISNGDAGRQLLINADDQTYAYNRDTQAFANVSGSTQCTSIGFLNGYGLRLDPNRSEVSFSAIEDFTTWDALDVFQRNDAADKWQRLLVNHKEIWLFGGATTSVYYNEADDPDIPFKPIPSVLIQMGIAAVNSACIVDDAPMWIGSGSGGIGVVYRAEGYTPKRVSTYAVEFAFSEIIRLANTIENAEGSTYQERGHTFYELTFPANADTGFMGATWRYDLTEGLWSECGDTDGIGFACLDTRGHTLVGQSQWTQSRTSGVVYLQSIDTQTANGNPIVRLRRAPHINQAQKRIRYSHLRLLMETGLGLGSVPSTTPGFDPMMTLSWSNDGGQTFGASYPISTGKIGEFSTLVEWRQLEQTRDRIFEFRCSAPVPWRLVDAFLDYSVGPS